MATDCSNFHFPSLTAKHALMKIICFAILLLVTTLVKAVDLTNAPAAATNQNAMDEPAREHPNVLMFSVLPSAADPATETFDYPEWIYVNREIVVGQRADLPQDRRQLYLFINGTHEKDKPRGRGPVAFCNLAADLGYHVLVLAYPDEIPASVCSEDINPNTFEMFRMNIIRGGNSKRISVASADCIENRLIKALQYWQKMRPKENWGQFLNQDGTIRWESIAVGGQSQGGGHATLIAIKHRVARVICTGSPKDFNHKHNAPAAYYNEDSATPKNRFFTFNHYQDHTGGTSPQQLLKNLEALGLNAFGAPANVDNEPFPYSHSRILMTAFPVVKVTGPQSDGSLTAHSSMLAGTNAPRWKQVWTYMLTEPTP
jgi:hypothetical protein